MTYFSINFPETYNDTNIYLKDIISEEVGMKFCMALMRAILDTQVEDSDVLRISWQRRALTGMMYDEFDNHLPSYVLRKR